MACIAGPRPCLDTGFPWAVGWSLNASQALASRGWEWREAHLDRILLVGDEVDAGLHAGMGPFPEHILLQLVDVWGAAGSG